MAYKNKEQQKEYQRTWIAARRKKWFDENGPCCQCGSDENLELHHKDPKLKVSHKIWSWSWKRIEEETAKCEVRCTECHKKPHRRVPRHGSHYEYCQHGCRCRACTEAHRVAWVEYKKKKNGRLV